MSGAKSSRPGLNRLMADARMRRCDVVLVWKLDRFGVPW
jgi:DNA invertase Pin-like site-specific DNA recombinase